MAVSREKKAQNLKVLKDLFSKSKTSVIFGNPGFNFETQKEITKKVREKRGKVFVQKNTIIRMAIEEVFGEKVELSGPCLVAFDLESEADVLKIVYEFSKNKSKPFSIKLGTFEGRLQDSFSMEEISKLPSKNEIYSRIVYLVRYPIESIAKTINSVTSSLVRTTKAVSEKLSS